MRNQENNKVKFADRILIPALVLFFILSFYTVAECQNEDSAKSIFNGGSYEETFSTSRIGVAQSVMTTPKGEYHLVIQHRFGEIKGGLNNFFGLDIALPRVGFEYGITNWLSGGIGRSLTEKTFDLELKAVLLKQNESDIPVSLSYYISVLDNTLQNYFPEGHNSFGSKLSFANQVFIARNQGILSVQVAPLWMHSNYEVRTDKSLDVYAIDIAGRIKLFEKAGVIAEYIPILNKTDLTGINPLTLGIDINTGGHQFQILVSNTQSLNEKSYLTNTDGSWSKGHLYFGFNLTRVFNRKM